MTKSKNKKNYISIIGLGYVGLPLAIEFGKYFNVIGFDKNKNRISQLNSHYDKNSQISKKGFNQSKLLKFSSDSKSISRSNIYIVTVPTPILKNKKPDLRLIINSINLICEYISKNDLIILESTVYPGVTEDVCAKIIEKKTSYKLNKDFFMGYSPERINPGDNHHNLTNIIKLVSGSNKATLNKVDKLYSKIIKAGTFKVDSIKIAESAKVIENTQRDVNIALMNEFSNIFKKMNLDHKKIFDAASTKWNFLNFTPGLVGGHCIGIDPYYLTYKAQSIGYTPNLILSARKINNQIPNEIYKDILKKIKKSKTKKKLSCLILGISFKENCSDVRNSKIVDLYKLLITNNINVKIYDPIADNTETNELYKIKLLNKLNGKYDIIIIGVAHKVFKKMGIKKIKNLLKHEGFIYDYKTIFNKETII